MDLFLWHWPCDNKKKILHDKKVCNNRSCITRNSKTFKSLQNFRYRTKVFFLKILSNVGVSIHCTRMFFRSHAATPDETYVFVFQIVRVTFIELILEKKNA